MMYRMPVVFGPSASPRFAPVPQASAAAEHSHLRTTYYLHTTCSATTLQAMLPTGFALRGAPLVAWEYVYMKQIHWLAGRGYNMLLVRIPVTWTSPCGSNSLDGWFQPVVWENLCDPIISGREELGWAKLFADLPEPVVCNDKHALQASWQGFTFLQATWSTLSLTQEPPPAISPLLHHKYIPATGRWDQAEVDAITVTPAGGPKPRLISHWHAAQASLQINHAVWEDMPTQFQVINGLHSLCCADVIAAGMFTSEGGKDLSDQYQLWPQP